MNKRLILLRGLPGSGKTTFAWFLQESISGCEIVSADDYFYIEGTYTFDASKLGNAHGYCRRTVDSHMSNSISTIVVHNTNTTTKEMKDYFDLAEKYGYTVTSLIVENRHGNSNVHSVPEETLAKMKGRFDVKL